MKSSVLAMAMFLLVFLVGNAGATQFDCASEDCLLNGTTGLWTCNYVNCPDMPNFTVYETIEEIHYELVNYTCDDTQVISELKNFTEEFLGDKQKLDDLNSSLNKCIEDVDRCNMRLNNMTAVDCTVYQNSFSSCSSQLTNLTTANIQLEEQLKGKENEGWLKFGIGFLIVAAIWFVVTKRNNPPDRTGVEQNKGDTFHNADAIEKDIKVERLQSELQQLRSQIQESAPANAEQEPAKTPPKKK